MTQARRDVIRKPTSKEELAKLHPIERVLLRTFEYMSSVKLAVVLMLWLCVECTIGTFIESRVNTAAARFFVYQTFRFYLLLALLGMNILCAALIRFPWRLYQTGFVITHCGLLILLTGSLITARRNVDAQMSVRLGATESVYLNPDQELLKIGVHTNDGEFKSIAQIPVQFGPFTWGTQLFGGLWDWRTDYQQEFKVSDSLTLRVKQFYANCSPERIYVESENGVPALQYRLYHPERFDITQWLTAEPSQGMIGSQNFGPGSLLMWKVNSKEELDHFVQAVPKEVGSLRGTLGFTYGGKHHTFNVDKLLANPQKVPETEITIAIKGYFPNAKLDRATNDWTSEGDIPENPLLKLAVTDGGTEYEYLAFGSHPEWQQLLATKYGNKHLLTYFPADIPPVVHVVMSPEGDLGYRAFGSQGLIASEVAEPNQEYPCWAELTFVPKQVLPKGEPDILLRPKLLKKGEMGNHGLIVELDDGKTKTETALVRGMPANERLGQRVYTIDYAIQQDQLPFKIRLNDFKEPKNPGTQQAAAYESEVTVIDEVNGVEKDTRIYMNHPLYYEGSDGVEYTLYQSGIDRSTGTPVSTFTVANDPGLETKYAGSLVLFVGIFLMFYMGGYFKKSSTSKSQRDKRQSAADADWQASKGNKVMAGKS